MTKVDEKYQSEFIHGTESDSDFGHETVEQNWYTFRQSHINVLCSIQRE